MSRNVAWASIGGSRTLFDIVTQFFKDDGWRFRQSEEKPVLSMHFRGDNGRVRLYAQVKEDKQQILFYSMVDSNVPPDKRQSMAEYLTRVNYGLIPGNFEMDFADGEIRFKTGVDVEGGQLTPTMIKNLVYTNVLLMDRYLPGIMSVIYGGTSPEEAVANIDS